MLILDGEHWKEVRCPSCRTLLCYENIHFGRVMHKCRKCGQVSVIRYKTPIGLLKKLIDSHQIDGNPNDELVLKADQQINSKPTPAAGVGEGERKQK